MVKSSFVILKFHVFIKACKLYIHTYMHVHTYLCVYVHVCWKGWWQFQWSTWHHLFSDSLTAAAAAKSLQSCLTLCNPIDSSPGSPDPRILQARTLEWVAISFSSAWKWKVKVKSLSRVGLLAIPRTAAYQTPLSMGFSRQEYWSGVPLPSPDPLTR